MPFVVVVLLLVVLLGMMLGPWVGVGMVSAEYSIAGFSYYGTRPELIQHYQLAARLVNNVSDGWFDDIRLTYHLNVSGDDADCDSSTAATEWMKQILAHGTCGSTLVGIVGPMCSSASAQMAQLSALMPGGIPQISPSSTAATLSDRDEYPYFMRVVPSDNLQSRYLVALVEYYGWQRVAMIVEADDTYSEGIADGFESSFTNVTRSEAAIDNEIIETTYVEASSDEDDMSALRTTAAAGAKVVLLISHADVARRVLSASADADVLNGEQYQWLAVDGWAYSRSTHNATGALDTSAAQGAQGALGLQAYINTTDPLYRKYLDLWEEEQLEDEDDDYSTVDTYGPMAADAIFAFAYALQSVENGTLQANSTLLNNCTGNCTLDPYDGDTLLSALYDVAFHGISGALEFTKNGERILDYEIVNVRNSSGEWESVGLIDVPSANVTITETVVWPHGASDAPTDRFYVDLPFFYDADSTEGEELEATYRLVVELVNDRRRYNGTAWFGDLLGNVFVQNRSFHSDCDAETMTNLLTDYSDYFEDVSIAVGAMCSGPSKALSNWSALTSSTLVLSYSATSNDLSKSHRYPLFARICRDDDGQADAISELFDEFQWRQAIVLFQTDSTYARDLHEGLVSALGEDDDEDLVYSVPVNKSLTDNEMESLLKSTSAATENTVVVLIAHSELAQDMLAVIDDVGSKKQSGSSASVLHPEDGYIWIASEAWIDVGLLAQVEDLMDGLLGFQPFANTETVQYSEYREMWKSLDTNAYPDSDDNRTTFDSYTPYVVDAVAAAMYAFQTAVGTGNDPFNATLLFDSLVTEGVTGDLPILTTVTDTSSSFSTTSVTGSAVNDITFGTNGDRVAPYNLVNLRGGHLRTIGFYSTSLDTNSVQIKWTNGDIGKPTDPPSDSFDDGSTNNNNSGGISVAQIAILTVFGGLILIVAGFLGYNSYKERQKKRRKVAQSKWSSALTGVMGKTAGQQDGTGGNGNDSGDAADGAKKRMSVNPLLAAAAAMRAQEEEEENQKAHGDGEAEEEDSHSVNDGDHDDSGFLSPNEDGGMLSPEGPHDSRESLTGSGLRPSEAQYRHTEDVQLQDPVDMDQDKIDDAADSDDTVRAALYCECAVMGIRTSRYDKVDVHLFPSFKFFFSSMYQDVIFPALCGIHMALAFWEPVAFRDAKDNSRAETLAAVELVLIVCYLGDLYLQVYVTSSFAQLLEHTKNRLYLAVIALVAVDSLIQFVAPAQVLRFSRPLRATIPILHSRPIESDLQKMAFSALAVLDLLVVFIIVNITFGVVGVGLFGTLYLDCDDCSVTSFLEFRESVTTLFVLLTTENWPSVAYTPVDETDFAYVYFWLFILISIICFSVLLAALYDAYLDSRQQQVEAFTAIETENLQASFSALTGGDPEGEVSFVQICGLLQILKPKLPLEVVKHIFEVVDADGSGAIDREEYVEISKFLLNDLVVIPDPDDFFHRTFLMRHLPGYPTLHSYVFGGPALIFSVMIGLANIAVLAQFSQNDSQAARDRWETMVIVDNVFMSFSIVEIVLRLVARGIVEFNTRKSSTLDVIMVGLSSVCVLIVYLSGGSRGVQLAFRAMRIPRVLLPLDILLNKVYNFKLQTKAFELREVLARIRLTGRIIARMAILIFAVVYFFAAIGGELWADKLQTCDDDGGSVDDDCEAIPGYDDSRVSFNTFGDSLEVVLDVFVKASFDNMLETTKYVSGFDAVWYWMFCYLLLVCLLINIMTALVIESYKTSRDHERVAKQTTLIRVHTRDKGNIVVRVKQSKQALRYRFDLELEHARQMAHENTKALDLASVKARVMAQKHDEEEEEEESKSFGVAFAKNLGQGMKSAIGRTADAVNTGSGRFANVVKTTRIANAFRKHAESHDENTGVGAGPGGENDSDGGGDSSNASATNNATVHSAAAMFLRASSRRGGSGMGGATGGGAPMRRGPQDPPPPNKDGKSDDGPAGFEL